MKATLLIPVVLAGAAIAAVGFWIGGAGDTETLEAAGVGGDAPVSPVTDEELVTHDPVEHAEEPAREEVEVPGPGRASAVEDDEPFPFELHVRDDRRVPIPRASLQAQLLDPDGAKRREAMLRSADGNHVVDVLGAGRWRVAVTAAGHHARTGPFEVELPYEGQPITVILTRAGQIFGQVLDGSGRPVPQEHVYLARDGARVADTIADDEGEFGFADVPAGSLAIYADRNGQRAELEVLVPPGGESRGLLLQFPLGGRVRGDARDADARAIVGAEIKLRNGSDTVASTVTDPGGAFLLEDVAPGAYTLMLEPDHSDATREAAERGVDPSTVILERRLSADIEVVAGEETYVLLEPPRRSPVEVRGRVTAAGEPVPRATLFCFLEGTAMYESVRVTQANDEGDYSVRLAEPGRYLFLVDPHGGTQAPTVHIAHYVPEGPEHRFDIALPVASLSGVVRGPDGSPVRGCRVDTSREDDSLGLHLPEAGGGRSTGASGRFSFPNLAAGRWTLRVAPPGGSGLGAAVVEGIELDADEAREVEVELAGGGTLVGRVVGPGGEPVPGAAVFVRDAAGRALSSAPRCTTDSSGAFTYANLPVGLVTASARTDSLASTDGESIEIRTGHKAEVEIRLSGATWLVVSVRDAGGPATAAVSVYDGGGREVGGQRAPGADERAFQEGLSSSSRRLGPFAPGRYEVVAVAPDGRLAKRTVRVNAEPEIAVELALD